MMLMNIGNKNIVSEFVINETEHFILFCVCFFVVLLWYLGEIVSNARRSLLESIKG